MRIRRILVAALATVGMAVGTAAATSLVAAPGVAGAQPAPGTFTDMSCTSANPLFWAPAFTWHVRAGSGESRPDLASDLQPSLLLSGYNDLPTPPSGLFPSIGVNWYGSRVLVDWHNLTTGATGRSVSDEVFLRQSPDIPINRAFTGTGAVAFTVTLQTGAGFWFVNPQNAVCRGQVEVVRAG